MTERRALTLAFTIGMGLWAVICTVLVLLGASAELMVLAMMAALGGTAHATSSVVLHYGRKRRGHDR